MQKKFLLIIFILQLFYLSNSWSQWGRYLDERTTRTQRSFNSLLPINLIDIPTANILTQKVGKESVKYFHLSLRVYNLGGMIAGISVGITKHLMFGVTYGGQNIVGEGNVVWNPSPGIHVRYKLFTETYRRYPTIALGFNSQGYNGYNIQLERYVIKSKGLYLVASQNFLNPLLGIGLHGGLNYSTENKGGDADLDFFLGIHLTLEDELELLWEYDLATNDNDENSLGAGRGYMNAAVRWLFANRLILEFAVKNLLNNRKNELGERIPYTNREIKIIYRQEM